MFKFIHRILLPGIVLFASWANVGIVAAQQAVAKKKPVAATKPVRHLEKIPARCRLVIVPDKQAWLVSAAVPVLEKLKAAGNRPVLLVVPPRPDESTKALLHLFAAEETVVLSTDRSFNPHAGDYTIPANVVTAAGPTQATLVLAKRIWGKSERVVVAAVDDDASLLTGALLAAHRRIPLLITDSRTTRGEFLAGLNALGVKQATLVLAGATRKPAWAGGNKLAVDVLTPELARIAVIQHLRARRTPLRTIVVSRESDKKGHGATACLSSYLCLARDGIPVLSHDGKIADVETRVRTMIAIQKLRPRSVTLLADYKSIGTKRVVIHTTKEKKEVAYELDVEPCMPENSAVLATYVVGRIPFTALSKASLLIARGFVRKRMLAKTGPRTLMIANPAIDGRGLPLCETVARATAEEFKNRSISVDGFYQQSSKGAEVLKAAVKANLIIYQGHVDQQQVFDDPGYFLDGGAVALGQNGRAVPEANVAGLAQLIHALNIPRGPPVGFVGVASNRWVSMQVPQARNRTGTFPWITPDDKPQSPLAGRPIVVLQSCRSLSDAMFDRVFAHGGVAMVGSVTSIHSASGSAFIKAFCDGFIHRRDTLGESLRDARNYFFCLQDLKDRRGHREQAKSQRVALSFRLWGDPELRVFPQQLSRRRRRPAKAAWAGNGNLKITLPRRRLDEVKTDTYSARMFANSQAAGLARKVKGQMRRKLTPIHFFRLPVPAGFVEQKYARLDRAGDKPNRAVFRTSPDGRFLYVLYFPSKEKADEEYTLRFSK